MTKLSLLLFWAFLTLVNGNDSIRLGHDKPTVSQLYYGKMLPTSTFLGTPIIDPHFHDKQPYFWALEQKFNFTVIFITTSILFGPKDTLLPVCSSFLYYRSQSGYNLGSMAERLYACVPLSYLVAFYSLL